MTLGPKLEVILVIPRLLLPMPEKLLKSGIRIKYNACVTK
jgi:hypothetical protein